MSSWDVERVRHWMVEVVGVGVARAALIPRVLKGATLLGLSPVKLKEFLQKHGLSPEEAAAAVAAKERGQWRGVVQVCVGGGVCPGNSALACFQELC